MRRSLSPSRIGVGYRAMADTLLPRGETYADVYARFRWAVPALYNIGVDVCDRHAADRSRVALVYEDDAGRVSEHTFAEFRARSNQLARALAGLGIARGDRVGIVLPQRPETAVAHLAAYQLGAVALPLSTLFRPDALEYPAPASSSPTERTSSACWPSPRGCRISRG